MKRLILISFLLAVAASSWAQNKIPIMGPARVSGSLTLTEQSSLPSTPEQLEIVNYNGDLLIYKGVTWTPIGSGASPADTIDIIYLTDRVKFAYGGYFRRLSGTSISISPNGSELYEMSLIANSEPYGVTMNKVQTIIFPLTPSYQTPLRGFTNDTLSGFYPDSTYALSKRATKQLIKAYVDNHSVTGAVQANEAVYGTGSGTVDGSQNISITEDSLKIINQATGVPEAAGFTSTGALIVRRPYLPVELWITDTTAYTPYETKIRMVIPETLNGKNLVKAKIYWTEVRGDRETTVTVWRNRGGTEVNMTSTGAKFTSSTITSAVINTAYDDVQEGDGIFFNLTLGSGTTAPEGVKIHLYFQ